MSQKTIQELLAANVENSSKSLSETLMVTITGQRSIKPTTSGLSRSMITTKEHGNFFILDNIIQNPVVNYGQGITAKMIVIPNSYKTSDGIEMETIKVISITLEVTGNTLLIQEAALNKAILNF